MQQVVQEAVDRLTSVMWMIQHSLTKASVLRRHAFGIGRVVKRLRLPCRTQYIRSRRSGGSK